MVDKETLNAPRNLVIINTRPCLIVLPSWEESGKPELVDGLKLLPGENDCPNDYWNFCKKNKTVKMYLACDYLKNKGEGKALMLSDGLDALDKHEALVKIAGCTKPQILKDWANKTQDSTLKARCEKRIKEVLAEAPD